MTGTSGSLCLIPQNLVKEMLLEMTGPLVMSKLFCQLWLYIQNVGLSNSESLNVQMRGVPQGCVLEQMIFLLHSAVCKHLDSDAVCGFWPTHKNKTTYIFIYILKYFIHVENNQNVR